MSTMNMKMVEHSLTASLSDDLARFSGKEAGISAFQYTSNKAIVLKKRQSVHSEKKNLPGLNESSKLQLKLK